MTGGGYDADWVLPPIPAHPWSEGCCGQGWSEHQWSEEQAQAVQDWNNTEPGLRQRLEWRRAALARLVELGAPEVILEDQRRLVAEIEELLS